MVIHKLHEHDMPCTHVPAEWNPVVHNSCFYTNVWGYFEDVKPLWSGFKEGAKAANCIRRSCQRAVNDNRHWRAAGMERLHGVSNSVDMISPVRCAPALTNRTSLFRSVTTPKNRLFVSTQQVWRADSQRLRLLEFSCRQQHRSHPLSLALFPVLWISVWI